ncbi:ATP binding [Ascosphaera aggregata]|nr:ATP binding [Ascosphaera aggregata]
MAVITYEHDLNGDNLIECDQQILKEIGVKKVGDRIRMLEAIKQLRKQAVSEDKEIMMNFRSSLVRVLVLKIYGLVVNSDKTFKDSNGPPGSTTTRHNQTPVDSPRQQPAKTARWSRQFDIAALNPLSTPPSPLLEPRHPGVSPMESARREQNQGYFNSQGTSTTKSPTSHSEPQSAGRFSSVAHARHHGSIDGLSMGQLPPNSPYIRVIYTGGQTKVLNIRNCRRPEDIYVAVLRKLLVPERDAKNYCFFVLAGLDASPKNCKRLTDSELFTICMDPSRPERGRLILRRASAGEPDSEELGRAAQFALHENQTNHLHALSGNNVRNQIKLQKLTGESWHNIRQPLSPMSKGHPGSQDGRFSGFVGSRPPSEMIIHELTSYFPSHQKEDIEKTVRLSVRRSKRLSRAASRLSVASSNSLAASLRDAPPIPTIAESWLTGDQGKTTPIQRPLSVNRYSSGLKPLPSVAYRDSPSLQPLDEENSSPSDRKFSFEGRDSDDRSTLPIPSRSGSLDGSTSGEIPAGEDDQFNQRLSMVVAEDGEEEDDDLKAFLAGNNFSEGNWMKGALIGEGSFGSVFIALHSITGELLAVKQVELPSAAKGTETDKRKNTMVSALEHEIDLLQGLHHENIVRYLGTSTDDNYLNIFLEYVPGGSIAMMLKQYNTFQEPLIQNFVRQILAGLSYLHGKNIIHRDIKGANILVDNKGAVKISDFGISKRANPTSMLHGDNKPHRTSLQGSVYWMAPEVVRQTAHTTKADIWSLGCLVVEMFIGAHPFPDHSQLQAIFAIGSSQARPPPPEGASEAAQEFLNMTFEVDYEKRPSADELRESRFVKQDLSKLKDYQSSEATPKIVAGPA